MTPPGLLTPADVAQKLGCSVRQVRRFVADKQLRVVRLGHRTVRVKPAELEAFIAARERRGRAA